MASHAWKEEMADIERDVAEIARRQEAGIAIQAALVERIEALTELVGELVEWANRPTSNDLTDAINGMTKAMLKLNEQMSDLPERVAAKVSQHQ